MKYSLKKGFEKKERESDVFRTSASARGGKERSCRVNERAPRAGSSPNARQAWPAGPWQAAVWLGKYRLLFVCFFARPRVDISPDRLLLKCTMLYI